MSGPNFEDPRNKTAYTDPKLFNFLLKHRYADSEAQARSEKSFRDLKQIPVSEGGALQRVETSVGSVASMDLDEALWKANHGLRMSFALRVGFEAKMVPYFKIRDNEHHRMAWTQEKDNGRAMIIDSLFRQAFFRTNAYTGPVI